MAAIQFIATPINPALRSRRWQLLRRNRLRAQRARNRVANAYVIRRHLNFYLARQIKILKQFFYGRHIYLLNQIGQLFLTLPNFLVFQALIGRKIGFQNLRLNFARRSLRAFVLAKKDWHYLRNYGIVAGTYFDSLFTGGYNFFSYELKEDAFSNFLFEVGPKRFHLPELTNVRLVPLVLKWHYKTFLVNQFQSFFNKYLDRAPRLSLSPRSFISLDKNRAELALWFSYYLVIQLNKLFRHRLRFLGAHFKKLIPNYANT
jgi:hypothetical protein